MQREMCTGLLNLGVAQAQLGGDLVPSCRPQSPQMARSTARLMAFLVCLLPLFVSHFRLSEIEEICRTHTGEGSVKGPMDVDDDGQSWLAVCTGFTYPSTSKHCEKVLVNNHLLPCIT